MPRVESQEVGVEHGSKPDRIVERLRKRRALERERQIRIEFRPHDADEPGVYGLLYHPEAYAPIYIILFRPTQNLAQT